MDFSPTFSRIVPKLCGSDIELANFISGRIERNGTGYWASRALLREIDGVPSRLPLINTLPVNQGGEVYEPESDSQDFGRKFLLNGGCSYVDLNHLELCTPETLSAWDQLAHTHALYLLASRAAEKANRSQPVWHKIQVLANNSDGKGQSFGSHLNFLMHSQAWEDVLHRRLSHQGFLAAYLVSSIIFTGQGKVGSENGAPAVDYQLSQRADFFERLCGPQTTHRRPIVNSRDEALCGSWRAKMDDASTADLARLHVIFYDHSLCHVAGLLKIGVMQIILAMIEAGFVNSDLLLEDPVDTVMSWSHDPLLQRRARLFSGGEITVVELQLRFFEEAQQFVATGACAEAIPRVDEILQLWGATLDQLKAGNLAALAPRLDWVRKLSLLHQALRHRSDLDWDSPEIKHLDHLYASLSPLDGLFRSCERRGLVERLVSEEQIARCLDEAPSDTRAWARAALLAIAQPDEVEEIDWDFIRFELRDKTRGGVRRSFTVNLLNPLESTRDHVGPRLAGADSLIQMVTALGGIETLPPTRVSNWIDGGYDRQPSIHCPTYYPQDRFFPPSPESAENNHHNEPP